MNPATWSVPVNPCYLARAPDNSEEKHGALQCNISAGVLVNINENTSASARLDSHSPFATYGFNEVIAVDAAHNKTVWAGRNKAEQAGELTEPGARHC